MSQIVTFLYEKTWTVFIYNLLSAVFIGSDWHIKTCQWYQNALYSIYKKEKLKGGGLGRVWRKEGRCVSLHRRKTLERVIPRPPKANSWRSPCWILGTICSHWYQAINKYITITHRGYNVCLGIVEHSCHVSASVEPWEINSSLWKQWVLIRPRTYRKKTN